MHRTQANARRLRAWLEDEPVFWGASQWRDRALAVCAIAVEEGVPDSIANAEYERFIAIMDRNLDAAQRIINKWLVQQAPRPPLSLSPNVERAFFDMAQNLLESK